MLRLGLASIIAIAIALPLISHRAYAAPSEVTMFGAPWCGPSRATKQFPETNRIPFRYLDIDDEKIARNSDAKAAEPSDWSGSAAKKLSVRASIGW